MNIVALYKALLQFVQSKLGKILLLVLVFLFTFVLRAHNYEKMPHPNHLDEMQFAWAGLSLVQTGTPVSWSTLDYPKENIVYLGEISNKGSEPKASVTLYKPWLDHPPVFSYIVGFFANYFGADQMDYVPSSYIRFPLVLIAGLTSLLIFYIGFKTSSFWMGLLGMIVYGVTPLFVFASRSAMSENFIGFLFSIIVVLLIHFEEKKEWLWLVPIPVLVGLAGLSKATGFFLLFFVLFYILVSVNEITHRTKRLKEWKKSLLLCFALFAGTLPFVFGFFWYGLSYGSDIFWRVFAVQSTRPVGFSSLAFFFTSPAFNTKEFLDSWFVFCLLALGYFLFQGIEQAKRIVLFACCFWILVVMFTGGEGDMLPWYRFAAFPFLALIGAWGMQIIFTKAHFFGLFLTVGMMLGGRKLLVNEFKPNVIPATYRFISALLLLPGMLYLIDDRKGLLILNQMVIVGVLLVGAYFNIVYIYNAFELMCESKACPIVPTNWLSELHFPLLWRLLVLY